MKQIKRASRATAWSLVVLVLGVSSVFASRQNNSQEVLGKLGVKKGICVVLDDPRCELALGLAKNSELILYVQVRKADDRQVACRTADTAGLYGTRIYVSSGDPTRIRLADDKSCKLIDPDTGTVTEEITVPVNLTGGTFWKWMALDDGRHLWTYRAQRNPHVLIRDDGLYIVGAGGLSGDTHKLDPLTGKTSASYTISRAGCTRATGNVDSIFFRGGGDGCAYAIAPVRHRG